MTAKPDQPTEGARDDAVDACLAPELDPHDPPPLDRFCDLVLQGGVIDGLVYPGLLVEVARRFRFHSLGGTSVGALAASLLAACEYRRRFGGLSGFNDGLRTLPRELAEHVDAQGEMTRIQSLFQAKPALQPLFALALDVIQDMSNNDAQRRTQGHAKSVDSAQKSVSLKAIWQVYKRWRPLLLRHFPARDHWVVYAGLCVLMANALKQGNGLFVGLCLLLLASYALVTRHLFPLLRVWRQLSDLANKQAGHGLCTGMRSEGSTSPGLTEWLYEGIQNAAGLPHAHPLTFGALWAAPCGPSDPVSGRPAEQSIRLFTITSALSHARGYKLPSNDTTARLYFKLSEWVPYFSAEVIEHLARTAQPIDIKHGWLAQLFEARLRKLLTRKRHAQGQAQQKIKDQIKKLLAQKKRLAAEFRVPDAKGRDDLRELPYGQLPVVVAARLSLSVPFLLDAMPMWAFDLENNPEDMALHRLWMSDGGLISNFPIHAFDQALPRWPTFGVQILDESLKNTPGAQRCASYIPYDHDQGSNDVFVDHQRIGLQQATTSLVLGRGGLGAFLRSIFKTLMSGEDQSHLRMPDVRNRVLRVYTQRLLGSAFNLKVEPEKIRQAAHNGVLGGRNLVAAYLNETQYEGRQVSLWSDHRWVRLNLLVEHLRQYLKGFSAAVHDQRMQPQTLMQQVQQAAQTAPLVSAQSARQWTPAEQHQLLQQMAAIGQLETTLYGLSLPTPYAAKPKPVLKSQPDL